jgi:hypothetical protein
MGPGPPTGEPSWLARLALALLPWVALIAAAAPTAARAGQMQEERGRGDLDGDGRPECWRLTWDGGTGYGWYTLEVRAGCDKRVARISLGGSFGSFCEIASLPAGLEPRLAEGIVDRFFGPRRPLTDADGSLAWLLERYRDRRSRSVARRGWTQPFRYTPRWQAGTPAMPPTQAVILRGPEEEHLARALARALAVNGEPRVRGPALLVYRAHNHAALVEAASNGGLTVYLTAHGVAVRDDARGLWSWAYVGTDQWKLRFPTTTSAATDGRLVAIERTVQTEGGSAPGRELVVIDPRAGRFVARELAPREHWSLDASMARAVREALARSKGGS